MDIKNLLKVNLINIVLLGLVALLYVVFNNIFEFSTGVTLGVTGVFALIWAFYAIYSNYTLLVSDKDYDDEINSKNHVKNLVGKLKTAGNPKVFKSEREALCRIYESVVSRKSYLAQKGKDERLYELYTLTENQIVRNMENALEYISTFDYISGRDTGYLRRIVNDSQQLLDKFNMLMELSVSFDDTSRDYDTRELDDMIESLQKMRDIGKGRLGG